MRWGEQFVVHILPVVPQMHGRLLWSCGLPNPTPLLSLSACPRRSIHESPPPSSPPTRRISSAQRSQHPRTLTSQTIPATATRGTASQKQRISSCKQQSMEPVKIITPNKALASGPPAAPGTAATAAGAEEEDGTAAMHGHREAASGTPECDPPREGMATGSGHAGRRGRGGRGGIGRGEEGWVDGGPLAIPVRAIEH